MLNEAYMAALLVERAGIEPFVDGNPRKARRLAEIDAQLDPGGALARAAHYEQSGGEITAPSQVDDEATEEPAPPAVEDADDHTPTETAITPRRGRKPKEN